MSDFAFLSASTFLKVPGPRPDVPPRPFGLAGLAWDGSTTNRPLRLNDLARKFT